MRRQLKDSVRHCYGEKTFPYYYPYKLVTSYFYRLHTNEVDINSLMSKQRNEFENRVFFKGINKLHRYQMEFKI